MRTRTLRKTQDPTWGKLKVAMQRLCNGDYSRPILIKCFHDKDNAAPDLIGHCETSVQELLDVQSKPLRHPKGKNKAVGTLLMPYRDIIKRHGFLEYVMGGMEIQMMIAVDFTGFVTPHTLCPFLKCIYHGGVCGVFPWSFQALTVIPGTKRGTFSWPHIQCAFYFDGD